MIIKIKIGTLMAYSLANEVGLDLLSHLSVIVVDNGVGNLQLFVQDALGGPDVVVVENTGKETTKVGTKSVDPDIAQVVDFREVVLCQFCLSELTLSPGVVDKDGNTNSGVKGSTGVASAKADAAKKLNTNGPAAKIAFLGGSSDGVLDHQDDEDEEEGAGDFADEGTRFSSSGVEHSQLLTNIVVVFPDAQPGEEHTHESTGELGQSGGDEEAEVLHEVVGARDQDTKGDSRVEVTTGDRSPKENDAE